MWDFISSQGGVATLSVLKSLPLKVSRAWIFQAEGALATAWLTEPDGARQDGEQLHLQYGLPRPQGSCVLVSSSTKRGIGYKNVGSFSSSGNRGPEMYQGHLAYCHLCGAASSGRLLVACNEFASLRVKALGLLR